MLILVNKPWHCVLFSEMLWAGNFRLWEWARLRGLIPYMSVQPLFSSTNWSLSVNTYGSMSTFIVSIVGSLTLLSAALTGKKDHNTISLLWFYIWSNTLSHTEQNPLFFLFFKNEQQINVMSTIQYTKQISAKGTVDSNKDLCSLSFLTI